MKIEFSPKRLKLTRVIIALFAISLAGYVAYAATQIQISNTGTVGINHDWQAMTFSPPGSQPVCSTELTYSGTPTPMAWGSIQQGSSATGYICVKNTGGTGSAYGVATSLLTPSTGITVTYNGTSTLTSTALQSLQTSLIVVVVSVANSVPSTSSFSYTTTIQ